MSNLAGCCHGSYSPSDINDSALGVGLTVVAGRVTAANSNEGWEMKRTVAFILFGRASMAVFGFLVRISSYSFRGTFEWGAPAIAVPVTVN